MRILFNQIKSNSKDVKVSFDNGNTYESYNKEDALKNGISIPESCNDLSSIIIQSGNVEIKNLYYEVTNAALKATPLYSSFKLDERVKLLTFSKDVEYLFDYAFAGNNNITDVIFPPNIKDLGIDTFKGCNNIKKLTIPGSLKRLNYGAFTDCAGLEEVVILEGVESLEDSFSGCIKLEKLSIPSSLKTFNPIATFKCNALDQVIIKDNYFYKNNIDNSAIITTNNKTIVKVLDKYITGTYNISSDINTIGSYAFAGCDNLINISIPNNITKIDKYAFCNCSNLKNVIIPNTIISLSKSIFSNCGSLEDISIPNSVTSIEDDAFWGAQVLQILHFLKVLLLLEETLLGVALNLKK